MRRIVGKGARRGGGGEMEIILASFNSGKAREIGKLLAPHTVKGLAEFGIELDFDALETGATYEENALIKARAVAALTGGVVVADDSGLEVEALGGRPGLHSARYGGPGSGAAGQCAKLLEEMSEVPDGERGARFVCVVAAVMPDGSEHIFEGECRGGISREAAGGGGFGFDPVFLLPGRNVTMAQIPAEEKNEISHRSAAFRKFREFVETIRG